MQNSDWLKIKDVFYQTLDLPEGERAQFLSGQPKSVRTEVEELIASHENAEGFIYEPAVVELGVDATSRIGKQIGGYKLIALIGTGGMGQVFLAAKDGIDKKFALKLIKRGMDTDAVLRRFVRERQILSRLEHANIARLIDGGSTDDGLPFFVMEYIDGLPVTKFCDNHRFDTEQRLEIFLKICEAIKYAHSNLVVHRDVKPSNILVTADGTPKLLDFGIAKLIGSDEFDSTTTAVHSRMFTPEYASPEQLNGLQITTATDVYSLGVVLYELLSGTRPFNAKDKSYQEVANLVLTQEPVRPSHAWRDTNAAEDTQKNHGLATLSRHKGVRTIASDVDNIILKSLRKEPERRYQSVQEFSDDVRRFLTGLPVTATADSAAYRFRKFIGRNKIATAIATVILCLSGLAAWQAVVATRERARAEERFHQVRNLANAVIFDYQDAIQKLPGATAVREKMVNDGSAYLDTLAAEKSADPDLQLEVAKAYDRLGDVRGNFFTPSLGNSVAARSLYDKALSIKQGLQSRYPDKPDYSLELADTFDKLADLEFGNADQASAVKYYQNAVDLREQLLRSGSNDQYTRFRLARGYRNIGVRGRTHDNTDESLSMCRKAIEMIDQLLKESPDNLEFLEGYADSVEGQAAILETNRDRRAQAIDAYRESIQIRKKQSEANPNNAVLRQKHAMAYSYLGDTFYELDNLPDAIKNYRICLETLDAMVLDDPRNEQLKQDLATVRTSLAFSLATIGRTRESLEAGLSVLQILEPKYANDPDDQTTLFRIAVAREGVAKSFVNLGMSQKASNAERIKNLENALRYYQQCLPIYRDFQKKGGVFPAVNEDLNAIVLEVTAEVERCDAQLSKLKGS